MRPRSLVLAALTVSTLPWSSPTGSFAAPRLPPKVLKTLLDGAESHHDAGDLELAAMSFRRILFAQPGYRKALRCLDDVLEERVAPLVKQASAAWDENREESLAQLGRAFRIYPRSKAVQKAYKERGYEWKFGAWRTQEELEQYGKLDEKRAQERREKLGLDDSFQIIRRQPFRFFTDVDLRGARSVLEQMMASIQSHYEAYLEIMEPFGLRYPDEGLDVVLFNDAEDYFRITGAPRGSAGVYIWGKKAGHFFRIQGTYNFPTMLHEMTHQLNDKVLEAIGISGWFEEGIAEHFGAADLRQGGRRAIVGRVDSSRLGEFQSLVRGRGNPRSIPFSDFVDLPRPQLSGRFYSQAWALAYYLMEGPYPGRLILYDYVASAKAARRGAPERSFGEILADYDLTLEKFEASFIEYYRTGIR